MEMNHNESIVRCIYKREIKQFSVNYGTSFLNIEKISIVLTLTNNAIHSDFRGGKDSLVVLRG